MHTAEGSSVKVSIPTTPPFTGWTKAYPEDTHVCVVVGGPKHLPWRSAVSGHLIDVDGQRMFKDHLGTSPL